jgi:hypothetical protein
MFGILNITSFADKDIGISEARCLPIQSGYALSSNAKSYRMFHRDYPYYLGLTYFGHIGQYNSVDKKALVQSCDGWFWWVPAAFLIGITIRVLGCIAINFAERSKQGKKSVTEEVRNDCQNRQRTQIMHSFVLKSLVVIFVLLVLIIVSCWLILREKELFK